jgi:hypothetical protein
VRSPVVDAVAGVGLDGDGHLIGMVKVCDGDVGRAELHLVTADEEQTGSPLVTWFRSTPLDDGVDTWRLDAERSGAWRSDRTVDLSGEGTTYYPVAWDGDGGARSISRRSRA